MSKYFNDKDKILSKSPVNFENYSNFSEKPKSHKRIILIVGLSALLLFVLYFGFYDQENYNNQTSEDKFKNLLEQYNVGTLGDDHAHTAITIFINNEKIDFSQEQFQLKSSYVHFENNNPYQFHRHATNVPHEILFDSIGIKITKECIIISEKAYCNSMKFFVNEKPHSDIVSYVPNHNDRILISLGEGNIPEQLEYLKSLTIHDLPKKTPETIQKDDFVSV